MKNDRTAAPTLRLRDLTRSTVHGDVVHVVDGYVTDSYRLLPSNGVNRLPEEDGTYEVRSLKAEPRLVPEMGTPKVQHVIDKVFEAELVRLYLRREFGYPVVIAGNENRSDTYILETEDGEQATLVCREYLDAFIEFATEAGVLRRKQFFDRTRGGHPTEFAVYGQKDEPCRALLVERTAYTSYARQSGGNGTGTTTWQALLMPVRIESKSLQKEAA